MYATIFFLSLLFAMSTHELGHALLFKRYGVQMEEICLCGVGPKLLEFRWQRVFGDTPVTIRLIPIAAFVKPVPDYKVNLHEDLHIFAGGIAMNLMWGGLLLIVLFATHFNVATMFQWTLALGTFCAGALVWRSAKASGYIVLLIGTAMAVFLVGSLMAQPVTQVIGGPAMIVTIGTSIESVAMLIAMIALISVSLGVMNALPLLPLDGGHTLFKLMEAHFPATFERWGGLLQRITFVLFLILIFTAFGSDFLRFF